ncbi:MAG: cysteine synthase family protein [Bdellovibrionales bacterium]|nr:cysteine synthase family protein [Bdellovibrionales bacterium]
MSNPNLLPNALAAIGDTPIVRLDRAVREWNGKPVLANLYAKLEFMNPGGSVKDRIGAYLIEDAEKRGELKPGGTVVEATSGNTGVGLGMAAAIKGYKTIFVLPDKMAAEKINFLRAFGAEVVLTPTSAEPTDPRSHYSVARRIAKDTPNAFLVNQYDNLANRRAHYERTGPEILGQMPEIDALVAGMGTGGTITGTGQYLKEKKPSVKVVCADPIGSIIHEVYTTGKQTKPAQPYKVEGIGEDFIPKNFELPMLDAVVQVADIDSLTMARRLLTQEGLFVGTSAGTAVVAALKWAESQGEGARGKNVLVILPDSGDRYMSKLWNDVWMEENGFLGAKSPRMPKVTLIEGAVTPYGLKL